MEKSDNCVKRVDEVNKRLASLLGTRLPDVAQLVREYALTYAQMEMENRVLT